jgi:tetratricopeptide (TPR) repeat protein
VARDEAEILGLARESIRRADADDWGREALEVNRRIIELREDAHGARFRLASCFDESGEAEEALAQYRQVAEKSNNEVEGRIARRRIGEIGEQVRAQQASSFDAAYGEGQRLRDEAQPELALHWLRRAYQLSTSTQQRTVCLAVAASTLRTLRRFDDALHTARRGVALDSDPRTNRFAHAVLIATLVDTGSLEQAATFADGLLRACPHDAAALNAAGRAYLALSAKNGDQDLRRRGAACFARAVQAKE